MDFYKKIRQLREEKGLTQAQIAQFTQIPLRQYQRYENGDDIPLPRAALLAEFFKVSLDYLAGNSEVREKR